MIEAGKIIEPDNCNHDRIIIFDRLKREQVLRSTGFSSTIQN